MHVSVVLSVYNGEATISSAVQSIVAQTYTDWDLVIIDDCSTDGTRAVLDELAAAESRISVYHNPKNLGLAAALNRGWRLARGQLVARIDADDTCLPERLQRQVAFLQEHPEVDVLGTDAWLVDEQGVVLGRTARPQSHEILATRIYRQNPLMHPTVMMRRRFLEETGGYDERIPRLTEDYDLWLRSYRRYRFHNLSLPLVRYRVGSRATAARMASVAYVLLRAAHREGLLFSRGWYSLWWLAAMVLDWVGLRYARPRPARPVDMGPSIAPSE